MFFLGKGLRSESMFTLQVDLQAQARAHRIGQKRDVLVLRFETVSYYVLFKQLTNLFYALFFPFLFKYLSLVTMNFKLNSKLQGSFKLSV